jgi:hypothetical protein
LPSDVASESQIPSTAGLIDATTATFISQSVVSTSTIACDQLTTPEGHEAVIRLFGTDMEAMLDARESAIRLQWSPYDYIYVSDTMVSFYIDGNEIFRVTPAQILYNNSPLATSSNVVPVFG